jgi:voltage-gated potassium channel
LVFRDDVRGRGNKSTFRGRLSQGGVAGMIGDPEHATRNARGPWLRRAVYEIIEPGVKASWAANLFKWLSILAILTSVICAVAATMTSFAGATRAGLLQVEALTGGFFLIEYALRLWTAAEHSLYGRAGTMRAVLRYGITPQMVLDAVGLVPIVLMVAAPQAQGAILMLQVLRFFRLARYSPGLATVGRVLVSEWRALMATGMIGVGMLLLAATAMYLLERGAQPDRFASIPQAMYWAIVTLATVGYGDVVPVTSAGKIGAGAVIIAGLIFFALPIAIIATSFLAEMRRRDFNINYSMVARVPLFATLDAIEISELASLLKSRRVPRDAVIVRKGDQGESMFFISRGEVEVLIPGGSVALREGEFFGEIAVIGRTTRNATVIARQTCDLLVLDAGDLLKLSEHNPQVKAGLDAAIAARQAGGATPVPQG